MATEVKLPEIADGVEKVDVVSVLVKVGDEIDIDTPLIDIEAEKASFTVPSKAKGRVSELKVKVGDKIKVGQVLLTIDSGAAAAPAAAAPAAAPAAPAAPANPTPTGLALDAERHQANKNIERNEEPPASSVSGLAPARPRPAGDDVIPAGPTVRRIARELGVDLRHVAGTGPRGRITLEDLDPYIKGFIAQRGGATIAAAPAGFAPVELPDFSKFGPVRRVKADALRRKIAERLSQAWVTVPHVHQNFDVDVTDLVSLQKRLKDRVKAQGGSLTVTVLIVKALAMVLKEFPQFNSTWDPTGNEIIYKDYYHIGVAVDTDGGLIVPVLRDVDKKTLIQLSKELPELAKRTRERKTSMDDLRGGTFTLSNLGGIGGSHFNPIVNIPEVAILGVGKTVRKPVFDAAGNVVARDFAPMCLGYDHRVIDGAAGARFVVRLTEILENFEAAILGF